MNSFRKADIFPGWKGVLIATAICICVSTVRPETPDSKAEVSAEAILRLLLEKGLINQSDIENLRAEASAESGQTESGLPNGTVEQAFEKPQRLPESAPVEASEEVRFRWDDGLVFEGGSKNKVEGKIGGRLMVDAAFYKSDRNVESLPGVGDMESQVELRRARLYTEGQYQSLSLPVDYKFEVEFAGASVRITDAYLGLSELPVVGGLQVGHFREPFGLEELTSSKYITFIERSSASEAFSPARNTGVMVGRTLLDERISWNLGAFIGTDDNSGEGVMDSNYRIAGRLTGLPFLNEERNELLHLGISFGFEDPENDTVRYRSTPESHTAPRLIDTGNIVAEETYLTSIEAAYVRGPFSLQGEYMMNHIEGGPESGSTLTGFYVFGSYFLTGESRPYSKSDGSFDRLIPKRNFSLADRGPGAWELGLRFSSTDLNEKSIAGGKMQDFTAGLNWYLNPNARLMLNYVHADLQRNGIEGNVHVFETRAQVDF